MRAVCGGRVIDSINILIVHRSTSIFRGSNCIFLPLFLQFMFSLTRFSIVYLTVSEPPLRILTFPIFGLLYIVCFSKKVFQVLMISFSLLLSGLHSMERSFVSFTQILGRFTPRRQVQGASKHLSDRPGQAVHVSAKTRLSRCLPFGCFR